MVVSLNKKYFSIGEIAKMFDISIQTLRFYDKIGILKPLYIREKSNYRYYSTSQFTRIDVIKYCRVIGISLEQIKELLNGSESFNDIIAMFSNHEVLIEKKIVELTHIRNHLVETRARINQVLSYKQDEVFIRNEPNDTNLFSCKIKAKTISEIDLEIRKIYLDLHKIAEGFGAELGVVMDYEKFSEQNQTLYKEVIIKIQDKDNKLSYTKKKIPKGRYLTIAFDSDSYENQKYYQSIVDFANKNNIKTTGDFYEYYVLQRSDKLNDEKILTQLELKIQD